MKKSTSKRILFSKINFLLVIPVLLFIGLSILGFDGLYGQDSYEYIRYATKLKAFLLGGDFPGDVVWPKGYLIVLAIVSLVLPVSLAGQLISLFCLYGIFFFAKKSIEELYQEKESKTIYLILGLLLSPYILRLSFVVMADTFAMLCLLGTVYYLLRYKKTSLAKYLWLSVLFGSYGVFSRYAVLVPVAPLFLYLFIYWLKKKKWSQLAVLVVPFVLLLGHFYLEGNGSDFANHHFIAHWSIFNLFKSAFITVPNLQLPNVNYPFPNGIFYFFSFFHPGFFILIPIAFLLSIKRWKSYLSSLSIPITLSIVVYSIFLSGITFQGNRYLSLTYPLLLLLAFPFCRDLLEKKKKYQLILIATFVLIQLALFYRAMQPSFEMNRIERKIAEEMKPYQENMLYSFEIDNALQQRLLKFEYRSIWEEELKTFEVGAYVLFNEPRIASDFAGKNPMNNWEKMNENYRLKLIKEIDSGWNLYQIEK